MRPRPTIIDHLARFRQRETDLSRELKDFFNDCSEALAEAVSFGRSSRRLKELLTTALGQLNRSHYNTGERELIAGLFGELAAIVEVDIHRAINRWCYGPLLLQPLMRLLHPKRAVETHGQH